MQGLFVALSACIVPLLHVSSSDIQTLLVPFKRWGLPWISFKSQMQLQAVLLVSKLFRDSNFDCIIGLH